METGHNKYHLTVLGLEALDRVNILNFKIKGLKKGKVINTFMNQLK